jgi:hypothetical protein
MKPRSTLSSWVAIADVDGDHQLDVIVMNASSLSVMHGGRLQNCNRPDVVGGGD